MTFTRPPPSAAVAPGQAHLPQARWVVVVPVKPLAVAKSRLAHPDRAALALAMAQDTVTAASRLEPGLVTAVVVVTNDDEARSGMTSTAGARSAQDSAQDTAARPGGNPRVLVIPDTPDTGLNAALAHGAAAASLRWPDRGVAALSADLAALRPTELRAALLAAPRRGRALVADAAGTGTVLLAAASGIALAPAFGPDSRAAHLASGAEDLTGLLGGSVRGLRRDVDTLDDLQEAINLGVGWWTSRVLMRHRADG